MCEVSKVYGNTFTFAELYDITSTYTCAKRAKTHRLFRKLYKEGNKIECALCGRQATNGMHMTIKDKHGILHGPHLKLVSIEPTGIYEFNVDHIIPSSIGGVNHLVNYRLTCLVCNRDRQTHMTPDDMWFFSKNKDLCKNGVEVYEQELMRVTS